MASFAEQGNIVLPQYQSVVQDYGTLYATIGTQLNQQHLQNRQAYIQGVIQPLAQMQVREEDRAEFEKIKSTLTEAANQFKDTNDWSKAGSFIFDTVESLSTNQGLKAMQTAYVQEQEYIKQLRESGWDLANQNAFILRSRLQSKPIKYNFDTNLVEEGGFNPIPIGKPFDVTEYTEQLSDIASNMTADKVTTDQIISDPTILAKYGISSILGLNDEVVASAFINLKQTKEELTDDTIAKTLLNLMDANPEYNNYINAVNTNKLFNKLYDSKTSSLRDISIYDWLDISDSTEYTKIAMNQLCDISKIGSYDKNGNFVVNPKADQSYIETINATYSTPDTDFDVVKILKGEEDLNTDIIVKLNDDYFKTLYNDNYINTGISYNDFLQNIVLKSMNQTDKYKIAKGLGVTHSKYSITTDSDIIANPEFAHVSKELLALKKHQYDKELAQYKYNLENSNTNSKPILVSAGSVVIDDQLNKVDVNENFNQIAQYDNYLKRVQIPLELEQALGIKQGSLLSELDSMTLDDGLIKIQNDSTLSDADKDTYVQLFTNIYNAHVQKRALENINDTVLGERSDLLSYYLKHGTVKSSKDKKWGDSTIAEDSIQFRTLSLIHNKGITNFEDYKKLSGEYKTVNSPYNFNKKMQSYNKTPYYMKFHNEKAFNRFIRHSMENAKNFINKNQTAINETGDDNNRWVTKKFVINGSSLNHHVETSLTSWAGGQTNNLEYEYHGDTPSEKKIIKIATLIGYNARNQSLSPNGLTQDLTNKKNNLTISASDAGLKGDYKIGYTKIQPTMDSQSIKNGYLTYNLNVYDTNGQLRDTVQLKEKVNYTTIRNYITSDYETLSNYSTIKGPEGDNARFMMGIYDSIIAQSDFIIKPLKGGDEFKTFDAIQKQVDNSPSTGVQCTFTLRSDPRIKYNVVIKRDGLKYIMEDTSGVLNPITNQINYNIYGYGSNLSTLVDENGKFTRFDTVEEIFTTLSSIFTLSSLR